MNTKSIFTRQDCWDNYIESGTESTVKLLTSYLPPSLERVFNQECLTQAQLMTHTLAIGILFQVGLLFFPQTCLSLNLLLATTTSGPLCKYLISHYSSLRELPKAEFIKSTACLVLVCSLQIFSLYANPEIPQVGLALINTVGTLGYQTLKIYRNKQLILSNRIKQREEDLLRSEIAELKGKIKIFDRFVYSHEDLKQKCFQHYRNNPKTLQLYETPISKVRSLVLKKGILNYNLNARMTFIYSSKELLEYFEACLEEEKRQIEDK